MTHHHTAHTASDLVVTLAAVGIPTLSVLLFWLGAIFSTPKEDR